MILISKLCEVAREEEIRAPGINLINRVFVEQRKRAGAQARCEILGGALREQIGRRAISQPASRRMDAEIHFNGFAVNATCVTSFRYIRTCDFAK